jgi:hypothetical protein
MTTLESRHIATPERLGVQSAERSLGCNFDLDQPSITALVSSRTLAVAALVIIVACCEDRDTSREGNRFEFREDRGHKPGVGVGLPATHAP